MEAEIGLPVGVHGVGHQVGDHHGVCRQIDHCCGVYMGWAVGFMGGAVGLAIITGYVVRLITAVGYMGWAVRLAIITGYVVRLITAVGYMGWAVGLAIITGYVVRLLFHQC